MASIQDSPHPLAFPLEALPAPLRPRPSPDDPLGINLRCSARALQGMQKEAIVANSSNGTGWRLVCDEGPYLNGSDLAPFPLGHFCAGMVSCYMAELVALLRERRVSFRNLKLVQDNRYSMSGSALAGTMTGSALPVTLQLVVDSPLRASELQALLCEALARAPVAALLDGVCINEFSLVHNGERLPTQRVVSTIDSVPPCPDGFDALTPASPCAEDLIVKVAAAQRREGVSGGVASSLQDNQQRILHMQGSCHLRDDGLLETTVELFQPLGSSFRFIADPTGQRAPAGLDYLVAGLAFCFLTQIGRYTAIRKWPLADYRIVQDCCFHPARNGLSPRMQPVVTHLFMQSELDADSARQVLDMGEQTCFLHAACRQPVPLELRELCRAIPFVP